MTWVKLDDHFDEHPKIADVGPLGIALWTVGLAYCNRNLTDGFIPWATARSLLSWEFLGAAEENGRRRRYTIAATSGMVGDDIDSEFVIELLLSAGMWDELEDGRYYVHDFDKYQPSRAEVLAEREKVKERQAKFRNKGSNAVTNASHNAVINDGVTLPPVPVPVPLDLSVSNPPTPQRMTPEQERVRRYLRDQAHTVLLKGVTGPDDDWCEDLIRRGLIESDVDYAIQGALNVGTLRYCRKILERRVEEREAGVDHDQLARDRAQSAPREPHSRSSGARGVARNGTGPGTTDDFGDAPPNSIRADDHTGPAEGDAGTRAPISFTGRDRTGSGAR